MNHINAIDIVLMLKALLKVLKEEMNPKTSHYTLNISTDLYGSYICDSYVYVNSPTNQYIYTYLYHEMIEENRITDKEPLSVRLGQNKSSNSNSK